MLRGKKGVEINDDHPNKNKQSLFIYLFIYLFIQSLLLQVHQLPSLASGRDSKAGSGLENLYRWKKGEASGVPIGGTWNRDAEGG